jgi:hypothetical protein
MKDIRLPIGGHEVIIHLTGDGGGSIQSDLKDYEDEDAGDYNSAIDGIESLILAHACAGVDIVSKAYVEGLQSALDAIANNL